MNKFPIPEKNQMVLQDEKQNTRSGAVRQTHF
jgi:hypothetical protein